MNDDMVRNTLNAIARSVDDGRITKEEAVKLTIRCILTGLLTGEQV